MHPTQLSNDRAEHEIDHGKFLSQNDPEKIWGWGSPAGAVRAQRRAALITQGAGLKPGDYVLEIGCGTGLFTEAIYQTGARILAVDISADLLEVARQRNLPPERVTFAEKRFEDCDIDGPFDAVVGSSILHHLDIKDAFPKIYSLLKPGGAISFAEPNMLNPQIFLQKNIPWLKARLGDSPDETAFFRWGLRKFLLEVGFTRVEIAALDWLHPFTPPSLIRAVSSVGAFLEKVPLVKEFAGSLYIKAVKPAQ